MRRFLPFVIVATLGLVVGLVVSLMRSPAKATTVQGVTSGNDVGSDPATFPFTSSDEVQKVGGTTPFDGFEEKVIERSFVIQGVYFNKDTGDWFFNSMKNYKSPQNLTIKVSTPSLVNKNFNTKQLIGKKISCKGRLTDRGVFVENINDVTIN